MSDSKYITMLELTLCDIKPVVYKVLSVLFRPYERVQTTLGNIFEHSADAIATPGNSYGTMDGGFDSLVNREFNNIQPRVQGAIHDRGTPLPAGVAVVVDTDDSRFNYLIYAPTVRIPGEKLTDPHQVYDTMLAILRGVIKHNEECKKSHKKKIRSLIMPGLGTGEGRLNPIDAGINMRMAYDDTLVGILPKTTAQVWEHEYGREEQFKKELSDALSQDI
jgi:O-acetyl-ADP-ribose deacetylase (regulator of RNase III)